MSLLRKNQTVTLVIAGALAIGACSSSSSSSGKPAATPATHATQAAFVRPACDETRPLAPSVTMSPDGPAERIVPSFDGTKIRAHWFPNARATAAAPLPTILKGPGWA